MTDNQLAVRNSKLLLLLLLLRESLRRHTRRLSLVFERLHRGIDHVTEGATIAFSRSAD